MTRFQEMLLAAGISVTLGFQFVQVVAGAYDQVRTDPRQKVAGSWGDQLTQLDRNTGLPSWWDGNEIK